MKYSTDIYIYVNKEYIMGIHTYAVFFPPKIAMFLYSEVIKSTSQAINIVILHSEQKLIIHLFFYFFSSFWFGLVGKLSYVVRDSSLSLFLLVMCIKFRLISCPGVLLGRPYNKTILLQFSCSLKVTEITQKR